MRPPEPRSTRRTGVPVRAPLAWPGRVGRVCRSIRPPRAIPVGGSAPPSPHRPPPPPAEESFQLVFRADRRAELADAAPIARKGDRGTQQHALGRELGYHAPAGLQRECATQPRRNREVAAGADRDRRAHRIDRRGVEHHCRIGIGARGAGWPYAPPGQVRRGASRVARRLRRRRIVAAGAVAGHAGSFHPGDSRSPSSDWSKRNASGRRRTRGYGAFPAVFAAPPSFATSARISRSFAFTRAAFSGPMRSRIFCPDGSASSAGSANS